MNFSYPQIVFQEVPNHISLAFSISGCSLACNGCHSTETWNKNFGLLLTNEVFKNWIEKYNGMVSCILFYGGEWEPTRLAQLLKITLSYQLKTALYTGLELEDIPTNLLEHLSFIKTGRYVKSLGGITNISSNQRLYDIERNKDITRLFNSNHSVGNIPAFEL